MIVINPVKFHNVILLKSRPSMSTITILSNNPNCSLLQEGETIQSCRVSSCPYYITILDSESLSAEFPNFLFSTSVRDLGVILDQELSFGEHITALTRSCYYHLRQLRVVSRSLSSSSATTLVHAFIAN